MNGNANAIAIVNLSQYVAPLRRYTQSLTSERSKTMPAYGTFRVTDKKCATCNYYQGARRFGMQANKPYYVYAAAGTTTCLANPSRKVTANSRCLSWQKWVSIP